MTSTTFCHFPWTMLNIDLEKDVWRWCPNVPRRPGFAGFYPLSKDLDSVKEALTNNQKPPQCNTCWHKEDIGFQSYRTSNQGNIPYQYATGLRFLDVFLGDQCNMNCATCGPVASSRWVELYQAEGADAAFPRQAFRKADIDIVASFNKFLSLLTDNIQTLQRLNISGGEPTSNSLFYRMLTHLDGLGTVTRRPVLRFVTSANYLSNLPITVLLSKLKSQGWNINVVVSFDAVGSEQEFVRAGLNWNTFETNLTSLITLDLCQEINVVVSAINTSMLGNIPIWLEEKGFLDKVKPNLIFATDPFGIAMLGGMGLYLPPAWRAAHKEHPVWKDFITTVNKNLRKIRWQTPDAVKLDALEKQLRWYAKISKLEIPTAVKKIFYLLDLVKRQPLLFSRQIVQQEDDVE